MQPALFTYIIIQNIIILTLTEAYAAMQHLLKHSAGFRSRQSFSRILRRF